MTHLENINEADEVLEFVATCLMTYDNSPAISGASCRGLSTILRFVQRTISAEVYAEELDDPEPLFRECPKGDDEIGEEGEEGRPQTVHPFKKLFEQIDREALR